MFRFYHNTKMDTSGFKPKVHNAHKRDISNYITCIPEEIPVSCEFIIESRNDYDSVVNFNDGYSPKSSDSCYTSFPEEVFKIKNLDTGEEIDIRDENKESFPREISIILGYDSNFFKLRKKMNLFLWEAIQRNDADLVESLIDKSKHGILAAQSNAKGLNDWSSMHLAAADGHYDICQILITKGDHTNINARTSMNRTPLHLATIHNRFEVVRLLLDFNADINAVDNELNSCLHYSSMQGYPRILNLLLSKNPEINLCNNRKRTPMDLSQNYSTLQEFINYSNRNNIDLPQFCYTRVQFNNILLCNSREDHVSKILLKASREPRPADLQTFNDRPKMQDMYKSKLNSLKSLISPHSKVGPRDFKGIMQLGKGSFGEVFLVEKIDTKVLYALKVLQKDKILNSNLIRYAFAERNISININHPFIVKLNYAFQTPEKLAMIMEYCPNGDLGMQILKQKKFSEEKAKFYAIEVLLALEELHNHGIIFRDLKPENVVLDADGHAKLTDFGLSKEGFIEGQLAKSFCGSIAYLAPEMLKKLGHTRSVDWYLFGVLIYEMLIGTPPYYTKDRDQLYANIKKGRLDLPKSISGTTRDLIKLLMQINPIKRLGASKQDAKEIKAHAFFNGVDWDAYYNKQVPAPPLKEVKRVLKEIPLEIIFGRLSKQESNLKLHGWTFLNPSDV
jgi:Protein kinase domain/Ankyrin repeats (3 copies)